MVLKPSEEAPLDAIIWSEVMHAAGTPKGVYNMIQGNGAVVGEAMSSHPGIDMMSFTGSTRAGIRVAQAAATTVKRVAQELGGKSANILLPDVDFQTAVTKGINGMMVNSGQSCTAPTRMFVPADRHDEVKAIAKAAAERFVGRRSARPETRLGPVVNEAQFNKIQRLIQAGIDEGAELVTGGPGRPENLNRGYFVRPTVFADVTQRHDDRARGDLRTGDRRSCPTRTRPRSMRLANDTVYGLAAYVQSSDIEHARQVASQMRAGNVHVNYPGWATRPRPFGGYKQSGNGREYGKWGSRSSSRSRPSSATRPPDQGCLTSRLDVGHRATSHRIMRRWDVAPPNGPSRPPKDVAASADSTSATNARSGPARSGCSNLSTRPDRSRPPAARWQCRTARRGCWSTSSTACSASPSSTPRPAVAAAAVPRDGNRQRQSSASIAKWSDAPTAPRRPRSAPSPAC